MKATILLFGALLAFNASANSIEDAEIVLLKPEKVTFTFTRALTIPTSGDESQVPVIRNSGLPVRVGATTCIVAGSSELSGRSVVPAGTKMKLETIMPDFYSDTGLTIIKPAGLWGLGFICVDKLAKLEEETGFPETADPEGSITVRELRAALRGLVEISIKR